MYWLWERLGVGRKRRARGKPNNRKRKGNQEHRLRRSSGEFRLAGDSGKKERISIRAVFEEARAWVDMFLARTKAHWFGGIVGGFYGVAMVIQVYRMPAVDLKDFTPSLEAIVGRPSWELFVGTVITLGTLSSIMLVAIMIQVARLKSMGEDNSKLRAELGIQAGTSREGT